MRTVGSLVLLLASLAGSRLAAQPVGATRPLRLVVDDRLSDGRAWTRRDPEQFNECRATFANGLTIPMKGDGDQDRNLCEFVRVTPVSSSARLETAVSLLKWSAIDPTTAESSYAGFWIGFGPEATYSFRLSAPLGHRPAQVQPFLQTDDILEPLDDPAPIAASLGPTPTTLTLQLEGREARLSVNGIVAARLVADTELAGAASLGLHANEVDMEVKFGFLRVYEPEDVGRQPVAAAPAAPPPAPPSPSPLPAAAPPAAVAGDAGAWRPALGGFLRQLVAQARRGRSVAQSFPGVRTGSPRAGSDSIFEVISGPQLPQASVYVTASSAGRRHRCYTARPGPQSNRAPVQAFELASAVRGSFGRGWTERQETPSGPPLMRITFTSPARRRGPVVSVKLEGGQAPAGWYLEFQVCRS